MPTYQGLINEKQLTRSFFLLLLMVLTWRMKTIENHISGATQRSLAFTRWTWATLNEPGLQSSHLSIIHRCLNYLTLTEYDGAFNVKHSILQMKESMYFPFFIIVLDFLQIVANNGFVEGTGPCSGTWSTLGREKKRSTFETCCKKLQSTSVWQINKSLTNNYQYDKYKLL